MAFVRSRVPVRRANRLGDTPLDYLQNALWKWAGGMEITPNQAQNIATDVASGFPGLKCDSPERKKFEAAWRAQGKDEKKMPQCIDSAGRWVSQTARQILQDNQKHGCDDVPWYQLPFSNCGGTGNVNWGLIQWGTIAWVVGAGALTLWAAPKVLKAIAK
jgi:hypothetical protein